MKNKNPINWDLSDLCSGMDDQAIQDALDAGLRRARDFAANYRGRMRAPSLTACDLKAAIEEYENILQESAKPLEYAQLLFACNTGKAEIGAFLQKMREWQTEVSVELMFFQLDLMSIPEAKVAELLRDSVLDGYRHYIQASRLFRDYRLSEAEEKVLEEKADTGRRALARLFEETVSNIPFHIERGGRKETVTMPEVLALMRDCDRETRRLAASSLTEGLLANDRAVTFVFNTLMRDKAVDDRLRNHACPEETRYLSDELERGTVELAVQTAVDYYGLVARYYRLKREILGLDKLVHYDRYAPLFEAKERIPFERSKEIVLGAFGDFSPVMKDVASLFFENSWIDAEVCKGKRGGAFCSYVTPDLHPYVFLNYLERMDDVMTLGHELGHGIHAYLARGHGYLSFSSVLPLAELASTFGEMLVFEALQGEGSRESRLALYAEKIEGMFGTIFRQAAMYRFEQMIHARRREKGELSIEDFSAIWQETQQAMYGNSLELGDEHRFWWMYISHFVEAPFYVYAYTFGELLVLALYAMYKKEGRAFVPKYIQLLETGGSVTPAEALGRVGIEITDPNFWRGGMSVLEGFIDRFEQLYRTP